MSGSNGQTTSIAVTEQTIRDDFFTGRQRLLMRRVASVSLLVMLLAFWWFSVYIVLVAGWWLLRGYSFQDESQNPYVFQGTIDLIFKALALVSLWPVHRWLRIQIAHFMEDSPDVSRRIISQLSQQMDDAQTTEEQIANLVSLLARTLNMPYVCIETTADDLSVSHGASPEIRPITLPLRYNQVDLGRLHLAPRLIGGVPVHVDEQMLLDLTRQISLTLFTMRLSADLQASRRRIVTALEEARRHLRRDLHDGLGPSLAAMTMQADMARELMFDDPKAAEELLTGFIDQTQIMVADIRRIVHGLRPPALDDVGLYSALELLVNSFSLPSMLTSIQLPPTEPTLSAATEVAIYRIVQEALTNISRHARARNAIVIVACRESKLSVSICDDGVGIPAQLEPGMGQQSMRERAEELGGTLTIESNTPSGTCVLAEFPLELGANNGANSRSDL